MRKFTISLLIMALSLSLLFAPGYTLERESFYQRYGVLPEGLILHLNQTDARSYGDSQNWYNLTGLDQMEQATGANQPTIGGTLGLSGACRTFDGDDYMHQKIYETHAGATFWPTNAGAIFAPTKAAFRVAGVDLSPFATEANDYMLVIHDSLDKTAWGYIDVADSEEALSGSELITNGNMEVDDNWPDLGTPIVNERSSTQKHGDSYSRKFTVDTQYEGIVQLNNKWTSTTGKLYIIDAWVYPDDTTTVRIAVRQGNDEAWAYTKNMTGLTQDSWNHVVVYYVESGGGVASYVYFCSSLGVSAGTWFIDDVSIQEVTKVGTDGVLIMSTKGGTTQSWAYQEGGIDLNDINSFEVLKTDFQHISTFFESWWVYCVTPTNFVIADKLDATGNKGYRIGIDSSDKPYCSIGDGTDTVTATWGSAISADTWYEISAGYDGTNAFISVNNETRVTATQSVPADTHIIYKIGSDGTNYADGNISIGIDLERDVSAAEVQRIYLKDVEDLFGVP